MISELKNRAKILKREVGVLYLVLKHPKTPLVSKLFLGIVVGYALSPVDLIPDFIPILGFLDDVILLPLGITLALKMIPKDIYESCRESYEHEPISLKKMWLPAIIIIIIWILIIYKVVQYIWR